MPSFEQVHAWLRRRGPGNATSSKGTRYRIEAINENIVAFPRSGRITIHEDCWGRVTLALELGQAESITGRTVFTTGTETIAWRRARSGVPPIQWTPT